MMASLMLGLSLGGTGLLHCAAMCGPIYSAAHQKSWAHSPSSLFRSPGSYHFFRLLSYTILSGLSGVVGASLYQRLPKPLLIAVLGIFILITIYSLFRNDASGDPILVLRSKHSWGYRLLQLFRVAMRHPMALGALTPLLPCGLAWSVFAAAATTGAWQKGSALGFLFALVSSLGIFGFDRTLKPLIQNREWIRFALGAWVACFLIFKLWQVAFAEPACCHG